MAGEVTTRGLARGRGIVLGQGSGVPAEGFILTVTADDGLDYILTITADDGSDYLLIGAA